MLVKDATTNVGGLSKPSKMPGRAYGLQARATCNVGGILAEVEGSPCFKCYAAKGRYAFDNGQEAQKRRLDLFRRNPKLWARSMIFLLGRLEEPYFRWFDSGDLLPEMFPWILAIVRRTPDVHHWMPTQERLQVRRIKGRTPGNLTVRVSSTRVGIRQRFQGFPTSSIDSGEGHICPAPRQGGECGECRACWDSNVDNVDYRKH
jgi:hypothetical protein